MTNTFIASISLVILCIWGFLTLIRHYNELKKKFNFLIEYRNKFVELANGYFESYDRLSNNGLLDDEIHTWLTINALKAQRYLGQLGISSYRPGFTNILFKKYQIIINTVVKFKNGSIHEYDAHSVDNSLLMYLGHLEDTIETSRKSLFNPILWFREGVIQVISVPLRLLNWFGVLDKQETNNFQNGLFFKILSGLIGIIAFVSSIITIILGAEDFQRIITRVFLNVP